MCEKRRRVRGKMASEIEEEKNQSRLIPLAGFSTPFHSHRESDSSERDACRVYRMNRFNSSEQRKQKMCPQDREMSKLKTAGCDGK